MPPSPSKKTFLLPPATLAKALFVLALLPRAILGWYFPQFNGDITRDVYALKEILTGHLVLVGPQISRVGEIFPHLGPFLYYLILPFLAISGFHLPQLGNLPIIILDSLASVLLFKLTYKNYGIHLGIIAWMLYAFALNNIFWGSFFWNGNYGPALVICCWYLLEKLKVPEVRRSLERPSQRRVSQSGASPEAGSTKKDQFLLAMCLVALTHMHLIFWCFILPALVLAMKRKLGVWLKFIPLWYLSLLPWLLAELQSGWANTQAFIHSQQTLQSGWPFHNLVYLYQTLMASWFWHDKLHRDLNAFSLGENPVFYLSLTFVVLTAIGLVILLRQKKKDLVLLLVPVIALLLLFPEKLNAERYWLFSTLPLSIVSLVAVFQLFWQHRRGVWIVYGLLACFLIYNVTATRQLLKEVSENRYEVDGTIMISVQETERRAKELVQTTSLPAIAIISDENTALLARGYLPLRYFAELTGKRVLAAPLDPGRDFNPSFFYPPLKTDSLCPSADEQVDVLWMHTRGETPPLPANTAGSDIYWATFEGRELFGRFLGSYACSSLVL